MSGLKVLGAAGEYQESSGFRFSESHEKLVYLKGRPTALRVIRHRLSHDCQVRRAVLLVATTCPPRKTATDISNKSDEAIT